MAEGATIATAYVQLVPTLTGVQGAMAEAFGGSEGEAAAERAGQRAGNSMLDGLKKIAGPAAIAGIAAGLFAVGSTFDDVSDSIRTATGKTGADLDAMVASAKNIGTKIPVEFDKIGPALAQVSQRTGLAGKDLETVTSQFLALGNVTGKDLNIEQTTAALAAFGVKGADVSTGLDDLLKISQSTGLGIDEITGSIQKAAPALQGLGFDFQQSAALVGSLDKAGLNATAVLGGMGKGLVKLAKDGEEPQAAFQRISGDIGTLVSQGKDAEAIDLASGLFGTKGALQFVEATKSGALNVGELTAQLDASSETVLGAQEDTADFAESWTLFKNKALVAIEPVASAVFGFAGDIMGKLLDAFDHVGEAVDAVLGFFRDYRDVLIPLGVVVLGLTANIIAQTVATVAHSVATKAVAIATEIWTVAQKALNLVLKSNPIGLVVAAIAALVAGVIWAYQNVGWFRDIVDKAWEVISDAAKWAWENVIKPVFDALSTAVSAVIDWFTHFGENLSGILDSIGGWISDAWSAISTFFTDLPGKIWDILVTAASLIAEYGWNFIDWYYGGIIRGAIQVFEWFGQLAGWVWEKIVAFASWVTDRGAEFISWVWNGIVAGAQAIWDWAAALPNNIWVQISALVETIKGYGGSFIGWIKEGIDTAAQAIWDWAAGLPAAIWAFVLKIKDDIIQMGKDFVGWIVSGVTSVASDIWNAITDALTGDATKELVVPGVDPNGTTRLGKKDGGMIAAATGGRLRGPGGPRSDVIPLWGSNGEYMINAASTAKYLPLIQAINADKFADGGMVGTQKAAKQFGADAAWKYAKGITDNIKSGNVAFNGAINVDNVIAPLPVGARGEFLKAVASQMGTPYVWGGDSPPGFDCSGLMSWALQQAGVGKGRQTAEGFNQSQPHVAAAKPGDMVTFDTGRLGAGVAAHIGAVLDPSRGLMMHTDGAGPARVSDYTHRDGGPLSILDAIGGSAQLGVGGGIVSKIFGKLPQAMGLNNQVGPSGEAAVPPGDAVERWRSTVLQALALTGQSASLANTVLAQINTESSGNPRAINLGDANARRGTPSKGLVQVIDPTFADWRLSNLSNDIYDPLANIVAGIRWAIHSTGSVAAAMGHGTPYDDGGWLMPQSRPVNLLRKPEPVLTPSQWQIAEDALATVSRGGREITMNVYQQPGQSANSLARELDRLIAFQGV